MQNWKRAVIAGSAGAATILMLKGKRPAAVLVGGVGLAMLASPIILYDYPRVAPESPGDLFDSTEIDELLALREVFSKHLR